MTTSSLVEPPQKKKDESSSRLALREAVRTGLAVLGAPECDGVSRVCAARHPDFP